MNICFNLFPSGRSKALAMSYDDWQIHDRQLVGIFNRYGIRGTFHLCSGLLDTRGYIISNKAASLYAGHEVSAHTCTHPFLTQQPKLMQQRELLNDRARLEELCGYPVRGMSWPFGAYSEDIISNAKLGGIEYSRTTQNTDKLLIPDDFMEWNPTTHHSGDLKIFWDILFDDHRYDMRLLYIWGHSYEFENNNNWDAIERFCKTVGGKNDVWYATSIEIREYIGALRRVVFGAEMKTAYNPSSTDVWFSVDEEPVYLPSGKYWRR